MFWGLIMEPGRCYSQDVKIAFHVSMAALDISNSSNEPSQVMCVFEGRNYLLCTLNKNDKVQCPLDLHFEAGTKVSFATNGNSHVHLTGYLTGMDDDLLDEDEEEEDEELVFEEPPKKKKKTDKKLKDSSLLRQLKEAQEEESDDSDFDLETHLNTENGEEEDEASDDEEEAEEEDDGEEEVDLEVSSLSDEEVEEDEEDEDEQEEVKPAPKVNGLSKKEKKQQKALEQNKAAATAPQQSPKAKKIVLKGGVIAEDVKPGAGEIAKSGKLAHVYYVGRLQGSNKVFDQSTKGPGFKFRLGKGEVIKGWDVGIVGMKVGGKRRLTCPPQAAYGPKGSPPTIPPNSTLVFEVELKKVS